MPDDFDGLTELIDGPEADAELDSLVTGTPAAAISINAGQILKDIMAGLSGTHLDPGFAQIVVDELTSSDLGAGTKQTKTRLIALLMQAILKFGNVDPVGEDDPEALAALLREELHAART